MIVRYYLQSAFQAGYTEHPQNVMKKLGLNVIKGMPETIADLWFFEIEPSDRVPTWMDVMNEDEIKTFPEWPK